MFYNNSVEEALSDQLEHIVLVDLSVRSPPFLYRSFKLLIY